MLTPLIKKSLPPLLVLFFVMVSCCCFAFVAVLSPEQLSTNGDNIVPPLWMLNSLVLVILGIFTMRRAE